MLTATQTKSAQSLVQIIRNYSYPHKLHMGWQDASSSLWLETRIRSEALVLNDICAENQPG